MNSSWKNPFNKIISRKPKGIIRDTSIRGVYTKGVNHTLAIKYNENLGKFSSSSFNDKLPANLHNKLIGLLLENAHINKFSEKSGSRLLLEQEEIHKNYLYHIYELFPLNYILEHHLDLVND